ncbi:class I SAM-dependent methyltransferase [Donghicola sp.]|jgi:16S rRNA (guanine1207-N2)-methyltransferase|uniref:class I SAM-dependent methyltransferase n=1 Tax=Donghicola sp. TaxID=1929294 RepID=UPI0025D527F4|nr:class I SAM-dependent methyltransferase [Donghicola sp.]MCT4578287.1 class I SAM-dependent methyltransferase [Donghicola sp.]
MENIRLSLALEAGLTLPEDGPIAVFRPRGDTPLDPLPRDRVEAIQSFAPDHAMLTARGYRAVTAETGPYALSIVCLPRAKDEARDLIARAMAATPNGTVVIDGGKTDGIESVLKDVRKRADVHGPISKAHGKIFWCAASDAFADWRKAPSKNADGYLTAPGVFSADKVDRASQLLVNTLPKKLGRRVTDLGAGWGYISANILDREGLESLHLVEAEATALDCARETVNDDRVRFHWADVTRWHHPENMDAVVMNPPFHTSRDADPAIGQAFIRAAHGMLAQNGKLWVVANRHLPYESTLGEFFAEVSEIAGDRSFKVLEAVRPRRSR